MVLRDSPHPLVGALGLLVCLCQSGCDDARVASPKPVVAPAVVRQLTPDSEQHVREFCSACHALPRADDFTKLAWRAEVEQGYNFYLQIGPEDLRVPPMRDALAYFQSRAPDHIETPQPTTAAAATHLRLTRRASISPQDPPAVANINWLQLGSERSRQMIICDMRSGKVQRAELPAGKELTTLATLQHPCHAEACDLDGDGSRELVVADLGSFLPGDHQNGRVVWLRPSGSGEYETIVLADKLARVADVQPSDFDGDGDIDLVVAEFGWRATGRLLLLESDGGGSSPTFKQHLLDKRHGAIHVPVADLNEDGRPDFVVLFGQGHESVEAFLNEGELKFRREVVFQADRPTFGSSGIDLVDLDQDGDLDVLYTNGDAMDSTYLRPYHMVQWLENIGDLKWEPHELAKLPGAHRAEAADFDGDGDLDIVASAMIPLNLANDDFDSVILLEQTAPGEFTRFSLERGSAKHATLEVGDFDEDGDVDVAVGNFQFGETPLPAFSVWSNDGDGETAAVASN